MGLSGIRDIIEIQKELYKTLEEICEEHNEPLVQFQENKPFCPICAAEKTAQDDWELRETETKKAQNPNKKWLRQRSVLTDRDMFNMTFENYETADEETRINKEKALNIARNYYKGATNNELLTGRFGTGKTHLAMAILNQLNEHTDMRLLFVSTDVLMRKVRTSMGDKESPFQEDRIVYLLSKADVLVLDDIGAEVGSVDRQSEATDFVIRIINGVLSGRSNKPTIITTNLTGNELKDTYDGRIIDRMLRGVKQKNIIQFTKTSSKRTDLEF